MGDPASPDALLAEVVARAREHGFVGRGSVAQAIEHARGFALGLPRPPQRLLDLGSGGGLPGLVLALHWTEAEMTLLDAGKRRCGFLREAVAHVGCADRVTVVEARAEEAGRLPELRGHYDAVTARGFGRPAVTAECAAPFLEVGGRLVVSEPPEAEDRWPADGLALVGLEPSGAWTAPYHYRSFVQASPCPARYPRRTGIPAKRPLF